MPSNISQYRNTIGSNYNKNQSRPSKKMKVTGTKISIKKLHGNAMIFSHIDKINNSSQVLGRKKNADVLLLSLPILLLMSQTPMANALKKHSSSLHPGSYHGMSHYDRNCDFFRYPRAVNATKPNQTQYSSYQPLNSATSSIRDLTRHQLAACLTSHPPGKAQDNSNVKVSSSTPAQGHKITDATKKSWVSAIKEGAEELMMLLQKYDPFKFPVASATPVPVQGEKNLKSINVDAQPKDHGPFFFITRNEAFDSNVFNPYLENHIKDFLLQGTQAIVKFYHEYNQKHPTIPALAVAIIKREIKNKFNLDINPNENYFVNFNGAINCQKCYTGWRHQEKPVSYQTLYSHLFTNFPASAYENKVALNSECGIYNIDPRLTNQFDSTNEVKILPSDFVELIWDLNFYEYAKREYIKIFEDKKALIQKNLLDFVLELSSAKLDEEAMLIVISGIGLFKDDNIITSQFDINGYKASSLFVFHDNKKHKLVLYMPYNSKKFFSFSNQLEMKQWIKFNCVTQEFRNNLASHFSLTNQQDGVFYSGIDSWLNIFSEDPHSDKYIDKINSEPTPIEPDIFFEKMSSLQVDRFIEDLDVLIKSDAEVARDMVEIDIDAMSVFPNPITPFASLGIHLQQAIEGDSYQEKSAAWNAVISDLANIVLMTLLDNIINLRPSKFEFIESSSFKFDSEFNRPRAHKILNVIKIPKEKLEDSYTIIHATPSRNLRASKEVLIEVSGLSALPETAIRNIPPNKAGIFFYKNTADDISKPAIQINNNFYPLEPGKTEDSFFLKSGTEIILFDDSYYIRSELRTKEVTYSGCLTRRDIADNCLHFSAGLEEILDNNLHKGFTPTANEAYKPHVKYPMFQTNANGKIFLNFKRIMFEVHQRKGHFIVVSSHTPQLFGKFFGKKIIAAIKFSPENGRYFLNTATENAIESLRCSKPAAALYQFSLESLISRDSLSAEELKSINYYCNDGSDMINGYMTGTLKETAVDEEMIQSLHHDVENIHALLNKLASYQGTVYRAGILTPEEIAYLQPGALMKSKRFLSTSVDKAVAESHAPKKGINRAMFTIHTTKAGHPIGIYTSRIPEAEVLIKDNTVFRCIAANGRTIELEEVVDVNEIDSDQVKIITT